MPAERVAEGIVRALRRDRFEVRIGRVKALGVVARLVPSLADAILARELGASPPASEGSRSSLGSCVGDRGGPDDGIAWGIDGGACRCVGGQTVRALRRY